MFPLKNGVPVSFSSLTVSASLLGTKDVRVLKGQTGHQLFKVTQAPGRK